MPSAQSGDTVRIHYTGKLEDGTVLDSTRDGEPLEFTIGAGQVIPGVEQAVMGMEPGESTSASIPPDQAYGAHREELVTTVSRERLPDGFEPVVGQQLSVQQPEGRPFGATVIGVSESDVVLDANHRLAGRNLMLDVELVQVRKSL